VLINLSAATFPRAFTPVIERPLLTSRVTLVITPVKSFVPAHDPYFRAHSEECTLCTAFARTEAPTTRRGSSDRPMLSMRTQVFAIRDRGRWGKKEGREQRGGTDGIVSSRGARAAQGKLHI